MSTPSGGDPDQGWSSPGRGAGVGDQAPGQDAGQPDYSQVQPDYGQPVGQRPLELAGFWIRFGGALIDGIILSVVNAILSMVLDRAVGQGLALIINLGYFTYFHGSTGQTLGNKAVSIKVIGAAEGGTIGYGRAFVRWLVSIVSGLVVLLGYLWMLWDPNNQTWHDKAARSVVVKVT